ncbi:MAG: SRPBCC family protein [Candidatus Dormibacteraeota bacterium]|nr:SRPBCC family protein [Candidatus Dormibacteraeota bacterium]MBV8445349.1 SRPBCC family protein [Candidatus Dormibacteraeota bacterium]
MTVNSPDATVLASVVVDASIDIAFSVFTEDIGSWWPDEHHLAPTQSMVFEPRVGGKIYDRLKDGGECRWSTVLAYEPPTRVVFSWAVSPQWQIETDPDRASEVEVHFIAEGDNRTRVELEHRKIDRHGDGWEQTRDAVRSDGGWPLGLRRFRQRLSSAS